MNTNSGSHEMNDSDGAHDAPGTDRTDDSETTSGVAQRYRRVLAVLPRAFRAQRGEEMLSTMLDAAQDEGRQHPSIGQWLSVLGLSLRLRAGAPGASPRARSAGEHLRLIALLGILLQAGTLRQLLTLESEPPSSSLVWDFGFGTWGNTAVAILGLLGPLLAMAALLRGWRRLGLVLMTANAMVFLATFQVFIVGTDTWWQNRLAMLGLCVVPLLAALLGFHRDAPRVEKPRWWSAATILAALSLLFTVDIAMSLHVKNPAYGSFHYPMLFSRLFEHGCALLVAALVVRHARRSNAGPLALAVAVSPLLFVLTCLATTVYAGPGLSLFGLISGYYIPGYASSPYAWIGAYVIAAELLLVITLAGPRRPLSATVAQA